MSWRREWAVTEKVDKRCEVERFIIYAAALCHYCRLSPRQISNPAARYFDVCHWNEYINGSGNPHQTNISLLLLINTEKNYKQYQIDSFCLMRRIKSCLLLCSSIDSLLYRAYQLPMSKLIIIDLLGFHTYSVMSYSLYQLFWGVQQTNIWMAP